MINAKYSPYKITKTLCYILHDVTKETLDPAYRIIKKNIELPQKLPTWKVDKLNFCELSLDLGLQKKDDKKVDKKEEHVLSTHTVTKYTIEMVKKVTNGHLTNLFNKKLDMKWEPFVCQIQKILFNKKNNRYVFVCNDGKQSFRVHPATQTFPLIKKNKEGISKLSKGDFIYVIHYAATILFPNKPKVVIFTNIKKIVSPISQLHNSLEKQ